MPHPDLAAEQAYLDYAHECLERMREAVARAAGTADNEISAIFLEVWSDRVLQTYEDASRGLCFGRLDFEGSAKPLYVGRRWVHEDRDVVVCNWQAPAARPFYTATPADPQHVTLRRRFRSEGRRLLDISDETLDGSTASVAGGDFLLEDLERTRDPHMRDIVATIQADQYRLITADANVPLVVQGGPGTGKTAAGLHRASWILYTHRETVGRRGVLVVGPNRTFMEYVSHVLPALGEGSVEQRAVDELVDGAAAGRRDARDAAAIKGDPRMAAVIARAVDVLPDGEPEEVGLLIGGLFVTVKAEAVAELRDRAREELGRTAAARERFRMDVVRAFYAAYARRLGEDAYLSGDEIERALGAKGFLKAKLDRAWPATDPAALVRRLLTSPSKLAEAAEGILDRREQRLLLRDRPKRASELVWSDHDLPLLDEATALLATPARRFGHVIVDEAQDLTPMQLRMAGRRAEAGAVTLLGDMAQATGPVAYDRWEEVLAHLPEHDGAAVEELRHAYRVPEEIMSFALPLLERVAPTYAPPIAFRHGGDPPHLRRVAAGDVLREALAEAAALARAEGLLAVIGPDELVAEQAVPGGSAYEGSIPLLTARAAKGLEFDHVVVVEPAAIAEGPTGLRELFVALTRPTRTLVVVHSRPLPVELG